MVKVERTFPAPESLAIEAKKKNGSYLGNDVIEQLRKDFHEKCYICEIGELQDPQVEHLLPHKNGTYPERKFDWKNLFWACGHCNSVKNQNKYDEGIIDCCAVDPEELLEFSVTKEGVEVAAKSREDEKVLRTAELITEVFDMKNTGMRVYKSEMRFKKLQEEMNVLYINLEKMKSMPKSPIVMRKLKALLRRESSFAAFKRGYVRVHLKEYPDLKEYIA